MWRKRIGQRRHAINQPVQAHQVNIVDLPVWHQAHHQAGIYHIKDKRASHLDFWRKQRPGCQLLFQLLAIAFQLRH